MLLPGRSKPYALSLITHLQRPTETKSLCKVTSVSDRSEETKILVCLFIYICNCTVLCVRSMRVSVSDRSKVTSVVVLCCVMKMRGSLHSSRISAIFSVQPLK